MTITIRLDTGNAAFEDAGKEAEVVRIITEQVCRVFYSLGSTPTNLRDVNGNTVGTVTVRGN